MSSQTAEHPNAEAAIEASWASLYRIAAIAALLNIIVGVAEIAITALPGGNITDTILSVADWYAVLQTHPFIGLRNLGLVNFFLTGLGIITSLGLYGAHRRSNQPLAMLALISGLLGTAVFFATNRAFPLLALSHQYAAATTDAERALLEATGQALLAVGRGHSPGTFMAFLFAGAGGLMMSVVMLRGGIFSRLNSYVGIVGFTCLMGFEIISSFAPAFPGGLLISVAGGLLTLTWYALIAGRLFRLGRTPQHARPA